MRASRTASTPSRKVKRTARAGLELYEERRLRAKLRKTVPSEPWVDAQIKTTVDFTSDRIPIVYCYHDPLVFPPGQKDTAMIRCPKCGIFNPPNAFEHGACLDHADHDGWGPSPSAVAIAHFIARNLRSEIELLPEDVHSLLREIRDYRRLQTCAHKS
jgi:hypothetical protein